MIWGKKESSHWNGWLPKIHSTGYGALFMPSKHWILIVLVIRHWKGQADVKCEMWNAWISPKSLNHLGVKSKILEPELSNHATQKSRCGDGSEQWIPISTLSNHSFYYWLDIGRVKLVWSAWISPNSLNLDVKSWKGCAGQPNLFSSYMKIGCGDHYTDHIPILTLSNHSLY